MKKRKVVPKRYPSRSTLIAAGVLFAIISAIVFYYIDTMVPVNSSELILGVPENHYVKIVNGPTKPMFAVQSSRGSKTAPGVGSIPPRIIVEKGSLVSIHLINEVKNSKTEKSQHNFNIDEFNVHSDTLGYFQTDIITFVADKTGTFEYYCSIHPEMRGKIMVE